MHNPACFAVVCETSGGSVALSDPADGRALEVTLPAALKLAGILNEHTEGGGPRWRAYDTRWLGALQN